MAHFISHSSPSSLLTGKGDQRRVQVGQCLPYCRSSESGTRGFKAHHPHRRREAHIAPGIFCHLWTPQYPWRIVLKASKIWVFPKNRGTPKWMIYNGTPYFFNGWFGGKTHHLRKHPYGEISPSKMKVMWGTPISFLASEDLEVNF